MAVWKDGLNALVSNQGPGVSDAFLQGTIIEKLAEHPSLGEVRFAIKIIHNGKRPGQYYTTLKFYKRGARK